MQITLKTGRKPHEFALVAHPSLYGFYVDSPKDFTNCAIKFGFLGVCQEHIEEDACECLSKEAEEFLNGHVGESIADPGWLWLMDVDMQGDEQ